MGAKVAVWRRGHSRPTTPRAVTRRGVTAEVGAVAARQGRRGVLYTVFAGVAPPGGPVRFAPVRIDGRMGKARAIAGDRLSAATLQFSGGRAIAGLVLRLGADTALLTARQRSAGTFALPQPFARVPAELDYSLQIAGDRRGGQVIVWWEGSAPLLRLVIGRKPLTGALRTNQLAVSSLRELTVGRPAASPDGWLVVPFGRFAGPGREQRVEVFARTPGGRIIRTAIAGSRGVDALAAAVTRGGAGAIATRRSDTGGAQISDQLFPLRGGRPRSVGSLTRPPHGFTATYPALTANPVDHARALLSTRSRLSATRLR